MNLKKSLAAITILALLAGSVPAKPKSKKADTSGGRLRIVATIFPEYDWMREILGDKISGVELTLLLGNGVDLHSYQPSIQDIAKISTADIFIYVGGESDGWVDDALKNATNREMKVINLIETLGENVKMEEVKEGMQAEEEDDEESDEEEIEYDEHVWLSLKNTRILCAEIADALCKKDAENAQVYRANLASYTARLDALDAQYADAIKDGNKKTVLFGDRFPFRYLVDDYGLDYYAAFVGCSAETEASFETIIFLARKIDELALNAVCKIETGDGKVARTVIQSSRKKNARILTMDSMQAVTARQAAAGTTYLGIMEENLKVLKEALD